MMKLGILGSTNGTDLKAIIEAEKTNKLKATINVVISNMEKCGRTGFNGCNVNGP